MLFELLKSDSFLLHLLVSLTQCQRLLYTGTPCNVYFSNTILYSINTYALCYALVLEVPIV